MALLSRLVTALVDLGADRGWERSSPPLGPAQDDLVTALLPAFERLRSAVEIAPEPPESFTPGAGARTSFRPASAPAQPSPPIRPARAGPCSARSAEPLDQAASWCSTQAAPCCAATRGPAELTAAGRGGALRGRLPQPARRLPARRRRAHEEPQTAVRGHRGPDGAIAWIEVAARPLRHPGDESVYGFLGVLNDVTAERDWEHRQLRAPGAAGPAPAGAARHRPHPRRDPPAPVPGAVRVRGAAASAAGPVALYVLDIDGTHLLRLAGPDDFPERLDGAAGARSRARRGRRAGAGRSRGVRAARRVDGPDVAARTGDRPAARLASRRTARSPSWRGTEPPRWSWRAATPTCSTPRAGSKETQPAAELQQSLLPPRIARIGGGEIAGSVLPAYEVGGDWFDYVENRDGAWIAVADAVGQGLDGGGARRHRAGGAARGAAQRRHARGGRPDDARGDLRRLPARVLRHGGRGALECRLLAPSAGSAAAIRRRWWCAPTTRSSSS